MKSFTHYSIETVSRLLAYNRSAGLRQLLPALLAMFLGGVSADAQPFNQVSLPSSLSGSWGVRVAPVLVDIDGNGTLDLFIGRNTGTIRYLRNTGTNTTPNFVEQTGTANPLNAVAVGSNAKPAFVDIDGDGDKDCFVGANNGTIYFYRNTGTAASPAFSLQIGASNPFDGIDVGTNSAPAFGDTDSDGDFDCVVGRSNNTSSILYFRNEGDPSSADFAQKTGAYNPCNNTLFASIEGNPFNNANIPNAVPAFINFDGDEDSDLLFGRTDGDFSFYTGTLNVCSPTLQQSTFALSSLSNLADVGTTATDFSTPTFGDLDGDGDLDLLVGRADGNFTYFENGSCTTLPTFGSSCNTSISRPLDVNGQYALVLADVFSGTTTATSACTSSSITPTITPSVLTCSNAGQATTVTVTATDPSNGRSATCTVSVTVTDNAVPVITNPSNCGTYFINLNASGNGTFGSVTPASITGLSATDNCTVNWTVVSQPSPSFIFNCSNVGITPYTINLRASDNAGNSATCTASVEVRDVVAPVPPASLATVNLTYCGSPFTYTTPAPPAGAFNGSDVCSGVIVPVGSPSSINITGTGTHIITWTYTDGSGNTATRTQSVVVTADPAPFAGMSCPANITVYADNTCTASATWMAPVFQDCTGDFNPPSQGSLINSHNSGATFTLAGSPHTVTYLATDAAGNSSMCNFTVTVADNTAPVISGSPSSINPVVQAQAQNVCGRVVTWNNPTGFTATDACSGPVSYVTEVLRTLPTAGITNYQSGSTFDYGSYTITYSARDTRGNQVVVNSTTVIVSDGQTPSVTCPPNQVTTTAPGRCNADFLIFTPSGAQVADNCPGAVVSGPFESSIPLNTSPVNFGPNYYRLSRGLHTINFFVTDNQGLSNACTFTVEVNDEEKPILSDCPISQTVTLMSACTATISWDNPIVEDNCTGITGLNNNTPYYVISGGSLSSPSTSTFVIDNDPPFTASEVLGEGLHTVTYYVTDNSGNTGTCSFTLTVRDDVAPIFTNCPNGLGVAQSVTTSAGVCGYTLTMSSFSTDLARDISMGCTEGTLSFRRLPNNTPVALNSNLAIGVHTLMAVATDYSGNSSTCQFSVSVADITAPTVSNCPSSVTLNTIAGQCYALPSWTVPSFSDPCGMATTTVTWTNPSSVTQNLLAGSQLPKGVNYISYVGRDIYQNPAFCSFPVTVVDNQAPVISACPNVTVSTGATNCAATVGDLSANDNCDGSLSVAPTSSTVALAPGAYSRTYVATDAAGNSSVCTRTITVVDNAGPEMTCPNNRTVNATTGCSAVVSWPTNAANLYAFDYCDGVRTPTTTTPPGSTFQGGISTVTYTATDTKGNSGTCTFTVTVITSSVPTITCPTAPLTITANANCQAQITNALMAQNNPAASDACGGNVVITNNASGAFVSANSNTTVTWTATNGSATSTCSRTVQVLDQSLPVLTCPAPITVNTSQQQCSVDNSMVPVLLPTATDNCASSFSIGNNRPATFNVGNVTVTFSVSDGNGNIGTCNWIVTVRDMTPPNITCPANVAVNLAANAPVPTQVALGTPSGNDNCVNPGLQTPTNNAPQAGFGLGTTTVTWTVLDAGGNSATCNQTVTVTQQTTPPPPPPVAACWDQTERLTPVGVNNAGADKFYGTAVDIDGTIAVVGAMNDDQTASNAGAAYVMSYNGTSWVNVKKLLASDGAAFDLFGSSVAISGDYIIVGAPESDPSGNTSRGAAYVYYRNMGGSDQWGQVAKLVAGDGAAGDKFGTSVAISGDNVLVGAPLDDDNMATNSGTVFVFERSGTPGNWVFALKLNDSAAGDNFGISVDLDGDYGVVGIRNNDDIGANAGAAFIYDRNAGWSLAAQLFASDGLSGDNFGQAVAISGDNIIVGAPLDDDGGSSAGTAFIFNKDEGGIDNWGEVVKIYAADQQPGDQFGFSVDIDGTNAVVGARNDDDLGSNAGSAYVFNQNEGGANNWGQTDKLTANDGAANDLLGTAVAIDTDHVLIGSQRDDVGSNADQGSVYVYANDCGNKPSAKRNAEQLASKVSVDCFPNPLTDYLNIEVVLTQEEMLNITIADAQGRIVATPYNDKANGTLNLRWDAARFDNGVYFVRVQSISHNQVIPVTIVRIP